MQIKRGTKAAIIILYLIFTFAGANAQQIELKGRVFDKEQNKPVEFANVALLSVQDSAVMVGGVSDTQGRFAIKANPGRYILNVGFIGYKSFYQAIELKDDPSKTLGRILLEPDVQSLEEVVIESTASMFESDIDKRTYNVENSILAQGGTARDILETLPSIQLDEEGNISMRGSGNLLIYINGRPTNLSSDDMESILDQFPANAISSIELITNPSARYDAAGVGGIINIILKKNQKVGFNGQVNAAIGTRHKYNGGFNVNYGGRKVNVFANYNYQYRQLWEQTSSFRNVKTGNVSPIMDQDYYNTNYNQSHLIRTGADINLSEKSTLGFYSQANYRPVTRNRTYNQRFRQINNLIDSSSTRFLAEERLGFNIENGLTYNLDIDDKGQKIYVTASHAYNYQERFEYFNQFYFNANGEEELDKRENQIYGRPHNDHLFVFQLDYEKPIGESGKIEAGLKSTISRFDHGQIFEELDFETGEYIANDTIADRFLFDEDVHAAFGIYRNQWGKLGMQAGLRAELSLTESYNRNRDETFTNNYFNLFPSLFVSYEVGKDQEFQANYSRRISRPGVGVLAPFYNVQDFLNLRIGNPYLQPVITDSYELGYSQQREKLFFSSTLYHRYSSNIITRIFDIIDAQNAIVTWKNANNSR
ncbi:MAG: TonB-dependent receptor domain-containing protein, partial [Cyclobacteriaceae bacterium]